MGIKALANVISEESPKAIKHTDIKSLFGRKVAIDASMSIYQFLIAVRQRDGEQLMSDTGETTSHLMGFFYRTLRMVDNGLKPCYVFDGKPPDLKSNVLKSRFEKREDATEQGEEAKETGDAETMDRLSRRTVRVTKEHNAECRKLLKLMGIPVIEAPSEAEAQCAELVRGGKVWAAGSEDMDTLTFGAPILLRHLTFSEQKKEPISHYYFEEALSGLAMEREQFTDLCILLGCDYLDPVKGVGPSTALKLIREHGSLDEIVPICRANQEKRAKEMEKIKEDEDEKEEEEEKLEREESGSENEESTPKKKTKKRGKQPKTKSGPVIPEYWPYEKARELFLNPNVHKADEVEVRVYLELKLALTFDQLNWESPDIDGLIQFLCHEKGFAEDRVRKGADRLNKMLNTKQQGRLDGFFSVIPKANDDKKTDKKGGGKRKAEDAKGKGGKKSKK
ncbi:hypothetical protein E3P77_00844 [Wallemia ichthyophaga]|uniref:Flap endonuclease 1 n=1 Tax=Wallemia ichthyophaga TaxID=245174 RepID=A0A4T0KZE0_WALIC|nr:hypothetical protein E3P97_01624 [Wallemia ichthyophaga]TIA95791.1 hypothetical protein E3P95_03545 [Wallemia ichthyophaga]TIA96848.1 hypothetical protein E3P94_03552 [Wallemia ichthyophaga]TIB02217.1 hypothetical protein E3P96_02217 [Wallemia ichthyophaga]TIB14265.1 hypothetical protein E3P90_01358 [Wallemia ichthyophaga]